jgi:aminoglycoside 6'-N-acetyltransferase I
LGREDAALLDRVAEGVFDEPLNPEGVAKHLASPGHHLVVALSDGEVVGQVTGVLHAQPDKPPEIYIGEVGVAPAFQRRGIARAMLAAMFNLARELGCDEAWVGTEPDNDGARRLYESIGGRAESFIMYVFAL